MPKSTGMSILNTTLCYFVETHNQFKQKGGNMRIDKVKFCYSIYSRRTEHCLDSGMDEEVDFKKLRSFRNGTQTLFETLYMLQCEKLPEDAELFKLPIKKDLEEEYGVTIRSAEIPVIINNPPSPSLSFITVVVDDDKGNGITVKDKDGKVILDLYEEQKSYEYIDITFRQLNRIINRVLKRKEKIR